MSSTVQGTPPGVPTPTRILVPLTILTANLPSPQALHIWHQAPHPTKKTSRDMNKRLQSLAAPKSEPILQFATMETSALIAQEYSASPAYIRGCIRFSLQTGLLLQLLDGTKLLITGLSKSPNSSIIQPQRNIDSVLRCPPPSKDFVGREKILQKLSSFSRLELYYYMRTARCNGGNSG
ncbi:hypothetical protein BDP27DRAFT_1370586 [Rhodocollybia butyracea]|uniref:Uncharacterized protein n=1 Tax=Rhodocollybia butyracea TaxID=206335 RepID=A0A9P5TZK6_9AGAR|nr:hypothetical protein BDP27DRAFT_1370586 [Rhodocollybia butyracea]